MKFIVASRIRVINLGTQVARFLPQCWRYRSVTHYRVKVGLSVLENVLSFHESTCLF